MSSRAQRSEQTITERAHSQVILSGISMMPPVSFLQVLCRRQDARLAVSPGDVASWKAGSIQSSQPPSVYVCSELFTGRPVCLFAVMATQVSAVTALYGLACLSSVIARGTRCRVPYLLLLSAETIQVVWQEIDLEATPGLLGPGRTVRSSVTGPE